MSETRPENPISRGAWASVAAWLWRWRRQADILLLLLASLVLIVVFRSQSAYYMTPQHLSSLANDLPFRAILVVAMTLLLVVGGIDLSIGSVMALSSVVIGVMVQNGWSVEVAILGAILTGATCGAVNGGLSVGLRIPSFIATLGMLEFARGAAAWLSDSKLMLIRAKIDTIATPIAG
ncbi:MAG: hypothetical protein KDA83_11560, partial [Planctomycetales bacterium]|nr:hypothetical protein [Planctomycetales bacterium]